MDRLDKVRANADLVVRFMRDRGHGRFGLDRASLAIVVDFIEEERRRPRDDPGFSDRMVSILGSYVGELILATFGGRWVEDPAGFGVAVSPELVAFPFAKVRKQWQSGAEAGESVLGFFDAFAALVSSRGESPP